MVKLRNGQEATRYFEQLLLMAETDPAAALALAETQLATLGLREYAVDAILAQWASQDPSAAWLWAQEHSPNHLIKLLAEIAKVDPHLAWNYAKEYSLDNPSELYGSFLSAVDGITYSGNYQLAVELLDSIDVPYSSLTPDGKWSFLEPALQKWVNYSTEEVAEWIKALPDAEDSAKKSLAHRTLFEHWCHSDPIASLDYAKELPSGQSKMTAVQMSINNMLNDGEITKAAEWLNENGEGRDYDWPVHNVSTHPEVIESDFAASFEWANSIEAWDIREGAFTEIATHWFMKDPAAARDFFSENETYLNAKQLQRAEEAAKRRIEEALNPPEDDGFL